MKMAYQLCFYSKSNKEASIILLNESKVLEHSQFQYTQLSIGTIHKTIKISLQYSGVVS